MSQRRHITSSTGDLSCNGPAPELPEVDIPERSFSGLFADIWVKRDARVDRENLFVRIRFSIPNIGNVEVPIKILPDLSPEDAECSSLKIAGRFCFFSLDFFF
jgi:hypothetical protein